MTFNFGSSGTLATQIQQGAPADTFASADEDNMDKLVTAEPGRRRRRWCSRTNKLVIVTKPGNPKNVKTLADLAEPGRRLAVRRDGAVRQVRGQILQTAGVTIPETQGHPRPWT